MHLLLPPMFGPKPKPTTSHASSSDNEDQQTAKFGLEALPSSTPSRRPKNPQVVYARHDKVSGVLTKSREKRGLHDSKIFQRLPVNKIKISNPAVTVCKVFKHCASFSLRFPNHTAE